ncbi:Sodium- and chloride-dependent glycine transporter 1 [Armadillidium nasatum]|uniref:Transporter n=1 Tax=Armadillidium nasatum TaxID=96803 RepID=A0A5N5SRN0_9CRUS|nr:Sodium- and chloride-dependent glycine transporter 1 [Armadillidium nasatum]
MLLKGFLRKKEVEPFESDSAPQMVKRQKWSNQIEFILSSLSYAVGLGNIWRFPYLCYRNGGGAFLIPYVCMLVFCGLPLMFFELCLGQFGREGPITVWKISPLFQACKKYSSRNCSIAGGLLNQTGHCIYSHMISEEEWTRLNESVTSLKSPSYEYFHGHVLDITDGLHEMGDFQFHIIISLFVAWIIVYLVLMKGVETFGKAVYFTATFPYLILVVLLIRAATLPGYMDGITFYLTPQDAFIVSIGNCLTSFFAGFVIFGIIGFMAHELGQPVDKVAVQGAGLAFVAYPEAVARLPLSPVWSVLFFAMLLTLGLGTQFTILTTITTTITDDFPVLRGKNFKWALLLCCALMFGVGLSMTTQGGMYVLQMMDSYSSTFSALMVGVIEVIVVTWVYGVDNFLDDIKIMLGFDPYPRRLWKYVWKFGMPGIVMVILVFSLVEFRSASYEDYEFPLWANIVGWVLSFSSVLLIPIVAIFKICQERGTLLERIRKLSRAQSDWAPPNEARLRPNESFGAKPLLKVTSFVIMECTIYAK